MAMISVVFWVAAGGVLFAKVDFNKDVRPILSEKCYHCHGPDEQKRFAGLRLDVESEAKKIRSQKGRAAITPGSPERSELISRIVASAGGRRMPLGKDPLKPSEIDILTRWVQEGAPYQTHWAYQEPQRPALPSVQRTEWARNPIDLFILKRLEQEGLSPSPEAAPGSLLRRLSLDLTGLPPKPSDVTNFERSRINSAYDQAVSSLLASPRFGETWARSWLDLARYAESSGYQHDDLRILWPYRDWVIRALNSDMPFRQFTIEQLAGDLLPEATLDQKIATGFHRNSNSNLGGDITLEESRHNVRIDRVNTTGIVWLASTIGCAQCHTHKYDPITNEDYYRMYAYFNQASDDVMPVSDGSQRKRYLGARVVLPVPEEQMSEYKIRKAAAEAATKRRQDLESQMLERLGQWEETAAQRQQVPEDVRLTLGRPKDQRNELQTERLQQFYLGTLPEVKRLRTAERRARLAMDEVRPPETLVMSERAEKTETHILLRGNLATPGKAVAPGPPQFIGPHLESFPPNRLGLAQWLVDRRNPLTARVVVNRIWAEIFGTGLVATTEDFGRQGEAPSHPELLDWLAVEFMDSGWSMKHIIRLMVSSAAYRQSSSATAELRAIDPANRLLSRGPRFRLPAESIRDVALAVSGLLSDRIGGPPAYPKQPAGLWTEIAGAEVNEYPESSGANKYRRGIYTVWRRGNPNPSMLNFDASTRMECSARRVRTNTPLQALTLLNDPVFVEAADSLAKRMVSELPGASPEQRFSYGFRLCTSRAPKPAELELLVALFERVRGLHADKPGDAEQAAWRAVARALLNLDETITKG